MVNAIKHSPLARLNNGIEMPLLGLGVYDMYGADAEKAVITALEIGYRLIDTASMYRNETEIGNAVRSASVPRSEVFITTKLNNADQGYDAALKAFDASLKKLQMDYIDLYLIHWPIKPKRKESWKALEKILSQKRARAIGVANYLVPFLEEITSYSDIVPAVDQVEFSPYLFNDALLKYAGKHHIQLQAYSPLVRGKKMNDPRLLRLSEKYHKTPAQIILRWNMELGVSAIPKSSNPKRLAENFDIFDFQLEPEEINFLKTFHDGTRVADDPMFLL